VIYYQTCGLNDCALRRCYILFLQLRAEHIFRELLLNPRYERWRWQTFGITWLIYASFYFTRQSFSVAKLAFSDDPSVTMSREDYGLVDSTYLTVYMLGQFVFGPLGDRFGPRRVLLSGMTLSVIAAIACGFSTELFAFMVFFAVLQGVAQSTGWSNVSKTMSSWFSLRERGRVLGWWCSHYTVGGALGLWFAGWAMDMWGHAQSPGSTSSSPYWPAAFWAPAGLLTIVTFVAWLLLRNRPEDVGLPSIERYHGEPDTLVDEEERTDPVPEGSWKIVGEVLSSPRIWMLAAAYFSIKLTRYAFIFWGPKYVAESLGSNASVSTITATAMPLGGLVGVIVCGYISDKLFGSRRAPVIILSLLIAAPIMLIGLTPIHNIWVMIGFFFLVGAFLFGPDSTISATAATDFGTKRGAGTAIGCINGIGSIGGILGGWLPGKITSETDWSPLFAVFLVGLAISAIVLLPLWNTKPPTAER
jgi:MFS transporter, OPA family, glycerol-3-phosphate transporter